MDYTTTTLLRQAIHIQTTVPDETLLARLVTAASRMIDFLVTGRPEVENYFMTETIAGEALSGGAVTVDRSGYVKVWPHKPSIISVSGLGWRLNPTQQYTPFSATMLIIEGASVVSLAPLAARYSRVFASVSYVGGMGTSVTNLNANVVELATLLGVRLYREDESGVNDVIGIAELGTVAYTKALPQRAVYILDRLKRIVPW